VVWTFHYYCFANSGSNDLLSTTPISRIISSILEPEDGALSIICSIHRGVTRADRPAARHWNRTLCLLPIVFSSEKLLYIKQCSLDYPKAFAPWTTGGSVTLDALGLLISAQKQKRLKDEVRILVKQIESNQCAKKAWREWYQQTTAVTWEIIRKPPPLLLNILAEPKLRVRASTNTTACSVLC